MTCDEEKDIKNLARSEFESAMAFGISLDNFVRLGMACSKYGEEAERVVSDRLLEALKKYHKLTAHDGWYADIVSTAIAEVEALRKEKPE